MRKSFAFGGLAALALLIAAPLSMAQPEMAPPNTPSTPPVEQPATLPATPPSATPPADPNPVTPTSPPEQVAPRTPASAPPQGCTTRKQPGEACACLSDPSRVGEAEAHPDGHNVCVRPT